MFRGLLAASEAPDPGEWLADLHLEDAEGAILDECAVPLLTPPTVALPARVARTSALARRVEARGSLLRAQGS